MNAPLLTIAIPTYNRKEDLTRCLQSIYDIDKQLLSTIEVCVSDNNSAYNVQEVVTPYLKKGNFTFSQNNTNLGFDGNILKLISLGKTDYLMFLGDDDVILQEGISQLIKTLNKNRPDAVFSNYLISFSNKKNHLSAYNIIDSQNGLNFDWALLNLRERLGFISSITINRRIALSAMAEFAEFSGKQFIHVAALFAMLHGSTKVSYCATPTVLANDKNPDKYDVKHTFIDNLGAIVNHFEILYNKHSITRFRSGILRHVILSGYSISPNHLRDFNHVNIVSLFMSLISYIKIVEIRRFLAHIYNKILKIKNTF